MDRRGTKALENAPLRERIRQLRDEVDSLSHAIKAEIDWNDKLHPVDLDDWDDDDAI
jgi:hypothetical protein